MSAILKCATHFFIVPLTMRTSHRPKLAIGLNEITPRVLMSLQLLGQFDYTRSVFALVVPCFNEADRFPLDYWKELIDRTDNCHWVFVDDGSTDGTSEFLASIEGENVHLIGYEKNRGKGEAVRFGFAYLRREEWASTLQYIGFIDSDSAFSKIDVYSFIGSSDHFFNKNPSVDVLIASRVRLAGRTINRQPLRHILGRVISTYICSGWVEAPYDTQTGFKIFKVNDNFWKSTNEAFRTSWFFDIEFIVRLMMLSPVQVWEEPLSRWDEIGRSSIRVKSYPSIMKQIIQVRRIVLNYINRES